MPQPIVVACRLRPFLEREHNHESVVKLNEPLMGIVSQTDPSSQAGAKKAYSFDYAFDSTNPTSPDYASQEVIYKEFGRQLLDHTIQGLNTTLFAYGQTGTGKTTTIMGQFEPVHEQGILLRVLHDLFDQMKRLSAQNYRFESRVRMLEIYNEKIQDLLLARDQVSKKLDVRVHPKLGPQVPHLTVEAVDSFSDCAKLINYGNTVRTIAATAMNSKSSRAHTIFVFNLEKIRMEAGEDVELTTSELYFVDLAGRENERTTLAKGERLVELGFINKSLFYLSQCIHLLGDSQTSPPISGCNTPSNKKTLTPKSTRGRSKTMLNLRIRTSTASQMSAFRNSKLTMLLYPGLTGNSRTSMIGTLSPALEAFDENECTLNFAATVKNIVLDASVTVVNKKDFVASLEAEVAKLKAQLAQFTEPKAKVGDEEEQPDLDDPTTSQMQEELDAAKTICKQYHQSWEQAKKQAQDAANQRALALSRLGVAMWKAKTRGPELPHLVNYSDDPSLDGTLVYYVPPGYEHSLGSSQDNDIVLQGIGIAERHCYLRNEDGILSIRLAVSEPNRMPPRVEINGVTLSNDTMPVAHENSRMPPRVNQAQPNDHSFNLVLQHHDEVVLGRSRAFYVVTKKGGPAAQRWAPGKKAEKASLDADITSVLLGKRSQDPEQVEVAKKYLSNLRNHNLNDAGETALRIFLRSAKRCQTLVDEANELTNVLRPDEGLLFELSSSAPMLAPGYAHDLPILRVRLVQRVSEAKKRWRLAVNKIASHMSFAKVLQKMDSFAHHTDDDMQEISIWPWKRFMDRLVLMRDLFDSWAQDPSHFTIDSELDPWKDTGPAECYMLLEKGHVALREKEDECRELYLENEDLKILVNNQDDDNSSPTTFLGGDYEDPRSVTPKSPSLDVASLSDQLARKDSENARLRKEMWEKDAEHRKEIWEKDAELQRLREQVQLQAQLQKLAEDRNTEMYSLNKILGQDTIDMNAQGSNTVLELIHNLRSALRDKNEIVETLKEEIELLKNTLHDTALAVPELAQIAVPACEYNTGIPYVPGQRQRSFLALSAAPLVVPGTFSGYQSPMTPMVSQPYRTMTVVRQASPVQMIRPPVTTETVVQTTSSVPPNAPATFQPPTIQERAFPWSVTPTSPRPSSPRSVASTVLPWGKGLPSSGMTSPAPPYRCI